ncbi:AzlC family ABC transporter permease [Novosphingobium sp. BL-8A]|uniref:AzlC family ABC transporter permease n=1 Tax=Novosphingobium sp. BL-8A TaxID=3127639 RepID=UPI003756B451
MTTAHTIPLNSASQTWAAEARRASKAGIPVLMALIPLAMVLGAQAHQKGLSLVEVTLMTGLNYAGGSEFAAIGLWNSPLPVLLIVVMTFLVNSRHLLMGAALAPYIRHLPRKVVYPALFFMVDESWAFSLLDARSREAQGETPAFSLPFYATLGAMFWVSWFSFATLGAILGPIIGDLGRWGFDMAFPAVFLMLIRGMWNTARAARPWMVSLVAASGVHLCVPGAWYVPAGAVAGLIAAWFWAGEEL